jgi:hypothetical protein
MHEYPHVARDSSAKRKKGKRLSASDASPLAVRHTFSAGLLGHDLSASQWVVNVGESTLLGIDAAFACVRLVSDIVAGADIGEWEGNERVSSSPLVRRPDPDVPRWEFIWQFTATLMLYQRAWVQSADLDGATLAVRVIAPPRVTETGDEIRVDGRSVPRGSMRLWRRAVYPTIHGSEADLVVLAREVFAAEMAASAYRSDFWQQGGAPVTVLTTDAAVDNTVADGIADRWVSLATTSPGRPRVLSRGLKPMAFGSDLGTEGANIAGDKLKASVARYLGVPPALINVPSEAGSMTYSNVEQESIHLVRFTCQPYCDVIGNAMSEYLPGDPMLGRRVVIDPSRSMRPDLLTWAQYLTTATGRPYMSTEEARVLDGRPETPLTGELAAPVVGGGLVNG